MQPAQRIQGPKTLDEMVRQTNIALERINGQIISIDKKTVVKPQAPVTNINTEQGTGVGPPSLNPGTVATDGITITGDGVNSSIALIEPFLFAVRATTTSPDAVLATDQFILASALVGGNLIENLPAAVGPVNGRSRVLIIYRLDANAHDVVITPNGTDTINGVNAAVSLVGAAAQYSSVRLLDSAAGAWLLW